MSDGRHERGVQVVAGSITLEGDLCVPPQAFAELTMPDKELVVVPGAGHLVEEPGALEEVARLAASWFRRYLSKVPDA
jgi:hypothetical protein